MLFNSIDFAVFLPIVFMLYWFVFNRNIKSQNLLIVVASYFFYGCWDWKFLILIFISTIVDFLVGLGLLRTQQQKKRKVLLWVSIISNLGILMFYKYFNFFIDNFNEVFTFLGTSFHFKTLQIILPVGISFYTFQTLSYTIDVYRQKLKPTKDFIAFSAFVSFFPQLVAGPIERASNLLPQFFKARKFIYKEAVDGLKQILWGLFKKIVIADRCAFYVDSAFTESESHLGSNLALGVFFFAFQIYCDFSGYSDIAIGTSRLFGFNLKQNFNFPYFSRNIGEFWRKWHISLSTWFRDYLYIPLGGSKGSKLQNIKNIFIVFLVSGFWHGAKWTFVFWGLIHSLLFLPLLLTKQNRKYMDVVSKERVLPSLKDFFQMTITFCLVAFTWIFFRANSLEHAFIYIEKMFSLTLFDFPKFNERGQALITLISVFILILFEWYGRKSQYAIENFGKQRHSFLRWSFYFILALIILLFYGNEEEFIYFQF